MDDPDLRLPAVRCLSMEQASVYLGIGFVDVQRCLRLLDPYLGNLLLHEVTGDVVWRIVQGEFK